MKRDKQFEIDTFYKLNGIAALNTNFWVYQVCDEAEAVLKDYMSHYRATNDSYDRPTAYKQFKRLLAYAYDDAHPGTVYKEFHIVRGGKNENTGIAYTLEGEGMGEEKATRELVASDYGIAPDMVICEYTTK